MRLSGSLRPLLSALGVLLVAGLVLAPAPSQAASYRVPSGLTQSEAGSTSVTMRWDAVAKAPRYRLQVSTSASMSKATYHRFTGTSGTVKGLKKGTTYYVKVRVITSSGGNLSPYSSAVKTSTSLPAPGGLAATRASDTSLTFGWKSVPGAQRYRIQLSRNASMSGATYHRFTGTSGTVKGLVRGATYYAKVRVITDGGTNLGPYSAAVKTATGAASLPAPSGLRATASSPSSVTFGWNAVPGAPRYRIQLSRSASMSGATYHRFTGTSGTVNGLAAGVTYYAKVRPITNDGDNLGPYSAAVVGSTTTVRDLPTPTGLRVTSAGGTSVRATWNAVPGAPRYRLQVATAPSMSGATYVRETSTARVLDGLEPRTTYYVKVRVITADGDNLSPYSDAVRVETTVRPEPLEVATYNVRCANCYEGPAKGRPEELPWADRRDAVVSTITSRMPDVVGLQEASQGWLKDASGKQVNLAQFEDLRNGLREAGAPYELTNKHRNNCEKSTTPTGCKVKDQGASQGTKLIYNTATTTLQRSGSKALPRCSGCNERHVAWGVFEQKATGARYFVANTHIEPGTDKESWRSSQLQGLVAEVERRNTDGLPVIVVGDLNQTRYGGTSFLPRDTLVAAGYVDPLGHVFKSRAVASTATVEKRVRAHYNSYGGFQRTVTSYGENENGSNLDYIFTSPMRVLQHETVLDLDGSGRLRGVIPSDHQMMVATVLPPA